MSTPPFHSRNNSTQQSDNEKSNILNQFINQCHEGVGGNGHNQEEGQIPLVSVSVNIEQREHPLIGPSSPTYSDGDANYIIGNSAYMDDPNQMLLHQSQAVSALPTIRPLQPPPFIDTTTNANLQSNTNITIKYSTPASQISPPYPFHYPSPAPHILQPPPSLRHQFLQGEMSDSDDEQEASPSLLVEKSCIKNQGGNMSGPSSSSLTTTPIRTGNLRRSLLSRPVHLKPTSPQHNLRGANGESKRSIQQQPLANSLIADPEIVKAEWKKEALQKLFQSTNLDDFLLRMYDYYVGKGFACVTATRFTHLLTIAFIVSFSTFIFGCIDFSLIHSKKHLYEVVIPNCRSNFSWPVTLILWVFWIWFFIQLFKSLAEMYQLQAMKLFFNHGLDVSEADIKTLSWREVVNRLLRIRDQAKSMSRLSPPLLKLDAHNIASRIMRQDNYLIALWNKDILNVKIPWFGRRHLLTKIMEWNIEFCVLSFVFDQRMNIKPFILNERERNSLVLSLRKRIFIMGFLNLIMSPFLAAFIVLYFFFRYAEEFHKNPSAIGSRRYSRFAYWKFREFNELNHVFQERLNRSHRRATFYMEQFPNYSLLVIMRFIAFVCGSFASVLALFVLLDQDVLLNFEITPGGTALFYIGIFSGIFAAIRNAIPEEYQVYDPETIFQKVVEDTHFLPDTWRDKMHTEYVKKEFGGLFELNLVLILQDLLSVIFAPWILWFSLMDCSDAIIDFFREFSVHVDGLGHICSFSEFDFKRHGNVQYGAPSGPQNQYYTSANGKMEQSFMNFKYHHPEWEPDFMEGSQYLSFLLSKMPMEKSQVFTAGVPIHQGMNASEIYDQQHYHPQQQQQQFLRVPINKSTHYAPQEYHNQYYTYQDPNELANSGLFNALDAVYEDNRRV